MAALRSVSLLALLLAALVACAGEEPPAPDPTVPVWVAEVAVRDLEDRVVVTGELLAKEAATVAAQVGGEITAIRADEGDAVATGAIVLEIDPERKELEVQRAEARLAEARATVLESERELRRMTSLADAQVASRSDLEQAEAAVEGVRAQVLAAEAELGTARRALRDATVRAAFDGRIARRLVSRGEYVREGQPLFELVSPSPLEVEFHLPEQDASRARLGLPLDVEVAAYRGETFPATVSVVSPTVDVATRTLRVKAALPNRDGRLRPGMFARADLGLELREDVLLVPETAVLQRVDGAMVFRLVGDDRVERRDVEIGAMEGEWVEIRSGLEPGDVVVRRGHEGLVDGAVVQLRNPDGTAPATELAPPPDGESAADGNATGAF